MRRAPCGTCRCATWLHEDAIDQWLRDGLLVDLYDTVRHSLLISERSYSIKKLEPLYMGENLRGGDVKDAGASVVAYAKYCDALENDTAAAARILESISDYNEYDCLSTLRLRDWLLGLVPHEPRTEWVEETPLPDIDEVEPSPEELALRAYLESLPQDRALTDDERAIAMVAAATGYHRREAKQFWWEHFDRLDQPFESWADTRNVFIVDDAEVVEDWHKASARARVESRVTELRGTMAEGSDFKVGSRLVCHVWAAVAPGTGTQQRRPGRALQCHGERKRRAFCHHRKIQHQGPALRGPARRADPGPADQHHVPA